MITYDDFIRLAEPEDIELMNLLAMNQPNDTPDGALADATFARAQRLAGAGILIEFHRIYKLRDDVWWQGCRGFIDPRAAAYLARAVKERAELARLPPPTVPAV